MLIEEKLMTDSFSIIDTPQDERGTWMQVLDGRRFYPLDPRPEEVFIQDIAQSLSRQIRYNGLSDEIINVGQHSCNAAWFAEMEGYGAKVQLAALMHDAAETYVADMVRPLKVEFPAYREAEDEVTSCINQALNLPIIDHVLIKRFDNLCLAWEKRDMYPSSEPWPMTLDVPVYCPKLTTWNHQFTCTRFLQLYHWLKAEVTYDG